jgi:hypothetical protein
MLDNTNKKVQKTINSKRKVKEKLHKKELLDDYWRYNDEEIQNNNRK